jgi:hypothetical protein
VGIREVLETLYAPRLIVAQVSPQGVAVDVSQMVKVLMRDSLTLEVDSSHFPLQLKVWMIKPLVAKP